MAADANEQGGELANVRRVRETAHMGDGVDDGPG